MKGKPCKHAKPSENLSYALPGFFVLSFLYQVKDAFPIYDEFTGSQRLRKLTLQSWNKKFSLLREEEPIYFFLSLRIAKLFFCV